jgi:hypothetical protein
MASVISCRRVSGRLKSILAKVDPASVEHVGTPYPAPKSPGEPSLLSRKLRGGGRRR